jgi:hypothetical protein
LVVGLQGELGCLFFLQKAPGPVELPEHRHHESGCQNVPHKRVLVPCDEFTADAENDQNGHDGVYDRQQRAELEGRRGRFLELGGFSELLHCFVDGFNRKKLNAHHAVSEKKLKKTPISLHLTGKPTNIHNGL